MEFAHTGDDELSGFRIILICEGGIFDGEVLQGLSQLLLFIGALRLDGHGDDRVGEVHLLKKVGVCLRSDRVTGLYILEADDDSDVACPELRKVSHDVGMHPDDSVDPFLSVLGYVVDGHTLLEDP